MLRRRAASGLNRNSIRPSLKMQPFTATRSLSFDARGLIEPISIILRVPHGRLLE